MIELGSKVRDQITGLEGIAVSRTEYLYGCIRIGVQPTGLSTEGEPKGEEYFDEQRLDPASQVPVGGPGAVPPPRSHP